MKMAADVLKLETKLNLMCTPRRHENEIEMVPTTFTTKAKATEHHNEDKMPQCHHTKLKNTRN
jgi:hypothetical protein